MTELTYRLFMVAEVGMLAGTVLLASSREVDPKWRKGVYVSAVAGIAWYHYQKMTDHCIRRF